MIIRNLILQFSLLASLSTYAQSTLSEYSFTFSGRPSKGSIEVSPLHSYGNGNNYGYDFNTSPIGGAPFFFSVDLPEGNYQVEVVVGNGGPESSSTTIKAESRRLIAANIKSDKGKAHRIRFAVNLRNTKIGTNDSVRIKPREIGKLIWDNKLTLEFNGCSPNISAIKIKAAPQLPTIFLAGNSTVVDEGEEPWCGWGQILPSFFTDKIAIANYAESGEASNSFVSSRRFVKLLHQMQPGDYCFIEFGHNDEKQKGEGVGPFTSFKRNMKYLVDEVKKKGGTPILVTPMHRRSFDSNGKIINTHGDYPAAIRKLAQEEGVHLVDLNHMSQTLYEAWGTEGSKKAFVHYPTGSFPGQTKPLADNTHFNSYGGTQIAKCIVQSIYNKKLPLAKYLRNSFKGFDPAHPDPFDSFQLPATPFSTTQKPDGN